jgi:two-component system chemotaxis response regulator CheB
MRLDRGPKINQHRPAIDPLFQSAALAFGSRVVGVILTGFLDDGVSGLSAIKRQGGVTVVQDPKDAFAPWLPENALQNVKLLHLDGSARHK